MSLFLSEDVRRRLRDSGLELAERGKHRPASFREVREFAICWSESQAGEPTGEPINASEWKAVDLLEEVGRRLVGSESDKDGTGIVEDLLTNLILILGAGRLDQILAAFAAEFGLVEPARRARPAPEPRQLDDSPPAPFRTELVRELLVFWWLQSNPALTRTAGAAGAGPFASSSEFADLSGAFADLLRKRPGLDPDQPTFLGMLEAPIQAAPDSSVEQLRWILPTWRERLTDLVSEIQAGLDLATEETAPRFPPGPGPAEVPAFTDTVDLEPRYSTEQEWMLRLVLVAKNCLVWLDQLSRWTGRSVRRLDQIPDSALGDLARQGFNTLWLIGLWERSPASRRIKQLAGNPEADSSAYAVRRYSVAEQLGGEGALEVLRARCERHGIRLAADMVPNHAAIDSDWVLRHPERFLWERECPFPSYTFEGPELSPEPPISLRIEDHYLDRTDAAVVFRREDLRNGDVRYLYHGNDGTSMPWNDTAQLDFLQAETREAVIGEILDVARRFHVIRFDAAMTLARRHYRRLWFPRPGDAGAIPSRAERTLSQETFEDRMPEEFWREVADRVEAEAPGTLLLAEAFWLMESHFVRAFGVHRVYNSAFMHMLRDGDNAGYRELIKKTLAFDPAILERYVNFMSNPDEESAFEQFGAGDRYFGVCALMATLPGTPIFAHGQVEGLREKYGMEYRRAYSEEEPDAGIEYFHECLIAPILRRRELFSGSVRFGILDAMGEKGETHEHLFAFVNGDSKERVLVVFNHSDGRSRARIPTVSLAAAVGLSASRKILLTDWHTGEENLFSEALDLAPYEWRVWLVTQD